MTTIPIRIGPIVSKLSLPEAVIMVIIAAIPAIETTGIALSIHFNFPFKNWLKISPAPIGSKIILLISHIILVTSISTNSPAKNFMSKGVTNGAIKVVIEVMVIDKARFALAK